MPAVLVVCVLIITSLSFAQKDSVEVKGGKDITLKYKNLSVRIDPKSGGRITSLLYDGKEFLTGKDIHPSNYGSTLWPSPQSLWNWPPPSILDSEEYQVAGGGDRVLLSSQVDENLGLKFEKKFTIGRMDTSLEITYTIRNISRNVIAAAPWEITRMPKGGIVCFPKGKTEPRAKTFDPIPYSELNNILWYKNEKDEKLDNHLLSVSDGSEGWLAYLLDGYIYIKIFEDVTVNDQFEGEGEIPVYVSPSHAYVEIEAQGKKNNLQPDSSMGWKMKWIIRKLPEEIKQEYQNDKVIKFIKTLTSN